MMVFVSLGKYQTLQVIEVHLLVGVLTLSKASLKSGCRLGSHVMVDSLLTLK